MTALKALAILETAVMDCKTRDINTLDVRDALNFLEPHTRPPNLTLFRSDSGDWLTTKDTAGEPDWNFPYLCYRKNMAALSGRKSMAGTSLRLFPVAP
jgi:hypothetical protein